MDNPENWQINVREYRKVIKNGQSRELATWGTQDERKKTTTTLYK
jgi:3-methyladenine DNA glycosylase AlkC